MDDYSAQARSFFGGNDYNSCYTIDYMLNWKLQQQKQYSVPQQLSPSGLGTMPSSDNMIFEDLIKDQEGVELGGNIILKENDSNSMQLHFIGGGQKEDKEDKNVTTKEMKRKRRKDRTSKSREEVERQRMTHIAIERNRRKQMNDHLLVLKSLMPSSYVQKGDQASIIGGVIEFVTELEQLLQCLQTQKRRRILEETDHRQTLPTNSSPSPGVVLWEEETAENKSCLADVEVKLLGFDAMIKILSRRRPGQLIKTIAALEDLHLSILHTNITTMEQTVLYSFNVKITNESTFTAQDIASSIQQIFSFIHANTTM